MLIYYTQFCFVHKTKLGIITLAHNLHLLQHSVKPNHIRLKKCLAFNLYYTGCAKSHDKIKYCIITFKIELRRNFPFIYSFFILRSIRLLHKIKNNTGNRIQLFVSCMHFHNCSWVNWGHGFQILHHFYSIRSTFFATACFLFATINYVKHYTGQQNQYFPLFQELHKLFLSNFWSLILNLCTYLLQKLQFLNYLVIHTIYP